MDYFIIGITVFIVGLFILNAFGILPYRVVLIDNPDPNSMHPTYQQGDMFIITKVNPSEIDIGDVIVYSPGNNGNLLIIHRVVDKLEVNGFFYFRVKGDNPITNSVPDALNSDGGYITQNDAETKILGKTIAKIPYLGHFVLAIQRNLLLFVFVILVSGILFVTVIFSDDKKKEKDKYIEINKKTVNDLKNGIKNFLRSFLGLFSVGVLLLIFILIIPQTFFPGVYYTNNENLKPGIVEIMPPDRQELASTSLFGQEYISVFYQVSIVIFDRGFPGSRIDSYTLEVYNSNNTQVSSTVWNKLGSFLGKGMIGSSIIIYLTNTFPNVEQELTIIVNLRMDSGEIQTKSLAFIYEKVELNI